MRLLLLFFLFTTFNTLSQSTYRRFGVGAQVIEPTGIHVQMFKGFFTDNNSSFATFGVWELAAGFENITGIVGEKKYGGGNWKKGGLRIDLNYLYPLLTVKHPFVFQTYIGAGLQTGSRKYETTSGVESDFSTGANIMIRVELVAHSVDIGPSVWFFSIYSDIKYHTVFSDHFDYISPVFGVRLRKGR